MKSVYIAGRSGTSGLVLHEMVERRADLRLLAPGVEGRAAYVSQLVVEEIVRNLIEHTPPYAKDETFTVQLTISPANVTVVIEDSRPRFDPLDAPALDTDAPLDERRRGGMGLHLVRNLTDELTYDSHDDCNRLTAVVSRL